MKKILFFLLACASSFQSAASTTIDLREHKELKKKLQIHDYEEIIILGFNEFKRNSAHTFLYKDKNSNNTMRYAAIIGADANGQFMIFFASEKCTQKEPFANGVISVNGKNIQVKTFCGTTDNEQMVGYKISTEEGNKYVVEQFKGNEIVYIRFQLMEIPFDSSDFNIAWDNAGGAAL